MFDKEFEAAVIIDDHPDVFDALAENAQIRRDAADGELVLLARAADVWDVDSSRVDEAAERLIQAGADGTA
ncbi:MAG: hypothetical protein ACK5LS_00055 [Propioniciclava sp.]